MGKKTRGRLKIKMEYISDKLKRYTTFSKRRSGIMKKAFELATLTGTDVLLLVASETGHVYTYATDKLKPIFSSDIGRQLIQQCLGAETSAGVSNDSRHHGNDVYADDIGDDDEDESSNDESTDSQSQQQITLQMPSVSSGAGLLQPIVHQQIAPISAASSRKSVAAVRKVTQNNLQPAEKRKNARNKTAKQVVKGEPHNFVTNGTVILDGNDATSVSPLPTTSGGMQMSTHFEPNAKRRASSSSSASYQHNLTIAAAGNHHQSSSPSTSSSSPHHPAMLAAANGHLYFINDGSQHDGTAMPATAMGSALQKGPSPQRRMLTTSATFLQPNFIATSSSTPSSQTADHPNAGISTHYRYHDQRLYVSTGDHMAANRNHHLNHQLASHSSVSSNSSDANNMPSRNFSK